MAVFNEWESDFSVYLAYYLSWGPLFGYEAGYTEGDLSNQVSVCSSSMRQ